MLMIAVWLLVACGMGGNNRPAGVAQAATETGGDAYTGSAKCFACHRRDGNVALWRDTGHARTLNRVQDATAPEGVNAVPPQGVSWENIGYVIGGAVTYARFIDSRGYVMTGPEANWSIAGATHTPYKPEVPNGTLAAGCVRCHATGWTAAGSYQNGVGNDLPGIPGAWFENGVGCEVCHGPGAGHDAIEDKLAVAEKKGDLKIKVDRSAELCGTCHASTRDTALHLAAPDLIESAQQYTEWKLEKHAAFKVTCIACHDPHAPAGSEKGMTRKCTDCHTGKFAVEVKIAPMKAAQVACRDCHMPPAARGAWDTMEGKYHRGDQASHLFGITLDPAYTLDDGSGKARLTNEKLARLTVEMTCYRCHQSGRVKTLTREQLLEAGARVH